MRASSRFIAVTILGWGGEGESGRSINLLPNSCILYYSSQPFIFMFYLLSHYLWQDAVCGGGGGEIHTSHPDTQYSQLHLSPTFFYCNVYYEMLWIFSDFSHFPPPWNPSSCRPPTYPFSPGFAPPPPPPHLKLYYTAVVKPWGSQLHRKIGLGLGS